jgi:hypothetical protein
LVKREYLTEGGVKIRILAYLFNKGEIGANAYVIQHRANIPMQEYTRLRGFLEDLCQLGLLSKREEETGGKEGKPRAIYIITESGRATVNTYRLAQLPKLFGPIEDLFICDDK